MTALMQDAIDASVLPPQVAATPTSFDDIKFNVVHDLIDDRVRLERQHATELLTSGFGEQLAERLREAAKADTECVAAIIDMLDWAATPAATWQARALVDEAIELERDRLLVVVEAAGGTRRDLEHLRAFHDLLDEWVALSRQRA